MRYLLIPALLLFTALSAQAQTGDDFKDRLEKVKQMTEVIERFCLSGHEVSGDASLDAGISGLKQVLTDGFSGNLSAEAAAREARGAINILEDKVKLDENENIRRCMTRRLDQMMDFLLIEEQSSGEKVRSW